MEKYYIMVNGDQQGPFTQQEIINKGFSNDSYIYNKALGGWKKISEVAGFISSETEKDIKLENTPKLPVEPMQKTVDVLKKKTNILNEEKDVTSRKLKKGFWAGLLAFIITKIAHIIITFSLAFLIVAINGWEIGENTNNIISLIDSPLIGIVFLILGTRYVYKLITK
jgi:hypothetical protein